MKNSLLITFFVIMTGFFHAQMQDLSRLANGNLVERKYNFSEFPEEHEIVTLNPTNGQKKDDKKCPLQGKVQIVNAFPDLKVQIVDAYPDIKVQIVNAWPDECGKIQFVNSSPDIKIKFVDYYPDIKIKFVNAFPGMK